MTQGRANWFGYNAPFFSNGKILPLQSDEQLIKNDLIQLLLTSPGGRVMRPTFGTPIRTTVFEQITTQDLIMLKDAILREIAIRDRRIDVIRFDVTASEDLNYILIKLKAVPVGRPEDSFLVEIGLPVEDLSSEALQVLV